MTTHMPKLFVVLFLMLAFTAWAGDTTPSAPTVRREFRQRKTYPYIFEPVSYLENGAPQPMRFERASVECMHRLPPLVPKPTPIPTPLPSPTATPSLPLPDQTTPTPSLVPEKSNLVKTQDQRASSPVVSDEETYAAPAYPPPENAQAVPQQQGALDLNKYPAEIVDVFKDPYNIPKSRKRLFDPVFEPAQPPVISKPAEPVTRQK
jgi:hypothetical protein